MTENTKVYLYISNLWQPVSMQMYGMFLLIL